MIAAITAGGRVADELAEAIGTPVKALARFGDRTMLDRAIAAARACGAERVVVVGGAAVRAACGASVDDVVAEGAVGRDNIARAIGSGTASDLLLMTSDLPFVDPAGLAAFLAAARGADVALPLASEADYLRAYPGAPPHVTAIGNERVANGSVVYFGPGVAPRALEVSQRLFDARKSLVRMAALLGPALLARFAVRRLRIEHVERRARMLLGLDARAVRDASPALCFDVDTIEDYRYAVRRFARE